jgi:hypothetical protein
LNQNTHSLCSARSAQRTEEALCSGSIDLLFIKEKMEQGWTNVVQRKKSCGKKEIMARV